MSYILDALNKSEKDKRQREATLPGLDTIHATPPPSAPTSGRRRFVAVIILIQAVIIGLGYWFVTRPHTQEVAIKPQSNPVPASTAPATPAMPPAQIPAARAGSKTAPVKPVPIRELPVDIQRQIPDLSFSSHIYSDDARFRMVNINGEILHEGDRVADGIRLVRITESGVVLTYSGYTFNVSVLHDWSFR